jgi:uncharacterized membrane protein
MRIKSSFFIFIIAVVVIFTPKFASAEVVLVQDREEYYKAKVVRVLASQQEEIPGTNTIHTYQKIEAIVLNKDKAGQSIVLDNDYLEMDTGDVFFLKHVTMKDGGENYTVSDIDRTNVIWVVLSIFIFLVIALGGRQGVLSLLSLVLSYGAMHFILFPGIIAGVSPILLAAVLSFVVLSAVMYMTHGFTKKTHSAFIGAMTAVVFTAIISHFVVIAAKLSGFTDDEAIYLNFNTGGELNFQGVLLAAIIIGAIGIIDDVAITQASVVSELRSVAQRLSKKEIYLRAMSVGKDHTGAVVNSLILAYTGAALPLVLLMYTSDIPVIELINKETIATEILRTLVGSIGLILTVPITTLIATLLIKEGDRVGKHIHRH